MQLINCSRDVKILKAVKELVRRGVTSYLPKKSLPIKSPVLIGLTINPSISQTT